MTDSTQGRHLIAGHWLDGEGVFRSAPATGEGRDYASGTAALVDRACLAAEGAFAEYAATTR